LAVRIVAKDATRVRGPIIATATPAHQLTCRPRSPARRRSGGRGFPERGRAARGRRHQRTTPGRWRGTIGAGAGGRHEQGQEVGMGRGRDGENVLIVRE
jgi:hypothetical protein